MRAMVSIDELTMIRDSIIMDMMLVMLNEKERKSIEGSLSIMKDLNFLVLDHMTNVIFNDLVAINKKLKKSQIKICDSNMPSDFVVNYEYFFRGYRYHFAMTRDVIRTQLAIKFGEYIAKAFQPWREERYERTNRSNQSRQRH